MTDTWLESKLPGGLHPTIVKCTLRFSFINDSIISSTMSPPFRYQSTDIKINWNGILFFLEITFLIDDAAAILAPNGTSTTLLIR